MLLIHNRQDSYAASLTKGRGVVSELELTRLSRGESTLYPHPELGHVGLDPEFRAGLANVVTALAWHWSSDSDFRRRLRIFNFDKRPLPPRLTGGSLGTALAVLAHPLLRDREDAKRLDHIGLAIAGVFEPDGSFGAVNAQSFWDKVKALVGAPKKAYRIGYDTLVVPEEQLDKHNPAP